MTAVSGTVQQLVQFKTGEGMHSSDNWHVESVLARLAPRVMEPFRASRQQNDEFDFTRINLIHVPFAWLAIVTLVLLIALARRNPADRSSAGLAAMCLIALLVNAAICGMFSNANDRYQSRIIWLAPFAALTALLARRVETNVAIAA